MVFRSVVWQSQPQIEVEQCGSLPFLGVTGTYLPLRETEPSSPPNPAQALWPTNHTWMKILLSVVLTRRANLLMSLIAMVFVQHM